MKKKKLIYLILMVFPLIVVCLTLPFLPEQIPAHYNLNNEVTRWGSKYETLFFPCIALFVGLFLLGIAKLSSKDLENGQQNEEVCLLAGIVALLIFNVMTLFFLYTDFKSIANLNSVPIDLYQLIFGTLGFGLIFLGQQMPKVKMNHSLGLRTQWSMKNETTWLKSQIFGGYSFIVTGIAILLICFMTNGLNLFLWVFAVIILQLIVDIFATWKIAKDNEANIE